MGLEKSKFIHRHCESIIMEDQKSGSSFYLPFDNNSLSHYFKMV